MTQMQSYNTPIKLCSSMTNNLAHISINFQRWYLMMLDYFHAQKEQNTNLMTDQEY